MIPDMAEPLTNESEANGNLTSDKHNHEGVSVATVESVTVSSAVPVSLPVGSLINVTSGTTFNVITPDQLQVKATHKIDHLPCSLILELAIAIRTFLFLSLLDRLTLCLDKLRDKAKM